MLKDILRSLYNNREFVREMAVRDLRGLHKGALLGALWLVISPLIHTAAYVVIVSFVFGARLGENSGPADYAIYVLSGMVPWQMLTYSLGAAPLLIRDRIELVKQVIYPIETLPLTSLIVGSFGSFVTFMIYLVLGVSAGMVQWTCVFMPLPLVLLVALVLGVSWAFMIVGVVLKDLREIVQVTLGLLVFFSPVVVHETMVSETIWRYILYNPLAHVVICFRDVFHAEFHLVSWAIFVGMALVALFLGAQILWRTKRLINEYI